MDVQSSYCKYSKYFGTFEISGRETTGTLLLPSDIHPNPLDGRKPPSPQV